MRPALHSLVVSMIASCVLASLAHAQLQLTCEIDGRQLPIAEVTAEKILVRDGDDLRPAPENAVWRLDGDLRANADLVCWAPIYAIDRNDNYGRTDSDRERPQSARIELEHWTPRSTAPQPNGGTMDDDWPDLSLEPALVVCIWVIDGRPAHINVNRLSLVDVSQGFYRLIQFAITPEEGRGFPVELLWRRGGFVAPKPTFKSPAMQRAMVAAIFDDAESLRSQIEADLPAVVTGRWHASLMYFAAKSGAARAVDVLSNAQKSLIQATTDNGLGPLAWAVIANRTEVVQHLLSAGAPVDSKSSSGQPVLQSAVSHGHADIVRALLRAGASIEEMDNGQRTALHVAIYRGLPDIADMLLEMGAPDSFLVEPSAHYLKEVIKYQRAPMVRWLLAHRADPNRVSRGETSLHQAARSDASVDIVRLLGAAGGDMNRANPAGWTPLMIASARGNVVVVEALLEAGASIDKETEDGWTALHFAARFDRADVAALLMHRGAALDATTSSGHSPLDLALLGSAGKTARTLSTRGAKLRDPSARKTMPMIAAAIELDFGNILRAAIADGWSPRNELWAGLTPLRMAECLKADECVEELRNADVRGDRTEVASIVTATEADAPALLAQPMPPEDPREIGERFPEHIVRTEVLIDTSGEVCVARIIESPDPRLVPVALDVARQWRFAPPKANGKPAIVRMEIPVRFPSSKERVIEEWQADSPARSTSSFPIFRVLPRKPGDPPPTLTVRYTVDIKGHVRDIEVREATGVANVESFVARLRDATFSPARFEGSPIAVHASDTFPSRPKSK